jgi:peptidase A4-like protein
LRAQAARTDNQKELPVRIERKVGATVAVTGSLLLALSGTVPALAGSHSSGELALATGARLSVAAKSQTAFGGWTFGATGSKSVTTEFKIPSLKCTKTTSGFGPLAAMVTGKSTAAKFSAAGLLMQCAGGAAAAEALVQVNTSSKAGTKGVFVGDLIQGTVTTTATKTTATVKDLTKGHTFTVTTSQKTGLALEELVIDDSLVSTSTGKQLPVVNFGKVTFSKASVSTKAIGLVKPQAGFNMATKKGVVQILVGKITGTKKNTFLTTWKHS